MSSQRVHQAIGVFLLVLVVPVLGACNSALVGSWKADPIPENADSYIANVKFNDDGTFRASARKKGAEPQTLRGKYDFNGFSLSLKKAGKGAANYGAVLNSFTKTLELSKDGQKQVLKKQ